MFDLSLNDLDVLDALNSTRLRALNLARNNISKVAVCALCNTSMQNLNLGYNKIVRLDLNVLPSQVRTICQDILATNNIQQLY